jgi:hypothetical protein
VTLQQFRHFAERQPFEPFAIHVADGRHFVVRHPEGAALAGNGRILHVFNEDGLIEVLDMLLVTSLRPLAGRNNAPAEG